MPGLRPGIGQFKVAHVTLMGAPPPAGVAITVYGPVVPGAGLITAVAEVGLLIKASSEGDLQAVTEMSCWFGWDFDDYMWRQSPVKSQEQDGARLANPIRGVATVCAGDAWLALPSGSVPTAETEYTVPGDRPPKVHASVMHVTTTGLPPATGTAVMV